MCGWLTGISMGAVCIYFGVPYCTDRIHYVLDEPEEQITRTSSPYCVMVVFARIAAIVATDR